MGTKDDIAWFKGLLAMSEDFYLDNCSDCFSNHGTNKYFRAYAEVFPAKKKRTSKRSETCKKKRFDRNESFMDVNKESEV